MPQISQLATASAAVWAYLLIGHGRFWSTSTERTMMTAPEPDGIVWHTSSYSGVNGACVEVAPIPDAVLIRDSKHRTGPALTVPTPAWHTFLSTVVTR